MRIIFCLALVATAASALGLGAPETVENLSAKDQEIVEFAFSQLTGSTVAGSYDCSLNKVRTENFSKQVVAGTLYRFDLVLRPECGDEEKSCQIVVFDQPWTKTREVQWDKVKCNNEPVPVIDKEEEKKESKFQPCADYGDYYDDSEESQSNENSSENVKKASSSEENYTTSASKEESTENSSEEKPKKNLPRVQLQKSRTKDIISNVLKRFKLLYKNAKQIEEKVEFSLLGNEQHLPHYKKGYQIIGGDNHDSVPHGRSILGGDDHDKVTHENNLIGKDDHDSVTHGRPLLGGDDHDKVAHENNLIGKDDHDSVTHGRPILGGDDHDKVAHENNLIGKDDHDSVTHGRPILGGDDHDKVAHENNLIGKDDHDSVTHGRPILGGDDHDKVAHENNLIGKDDHDSVSHGKKLLGGDDHDFIFHNILSGGAKNGHAIVGGGKPHGPRFDAIMDNAPVDANDEFMLRKLPPMEESLRKLKDMQSERSFRSFMTLHGKKYKNKVEQQKRFIIFKENMKKVQFLQETELGTGVYGATHLSDLTEQEFKTNYLGMNLKKDDPDIHWPAADIPDVDIPTAFDWRDHNAVTPVKNQGMCGSCWAFSVSGNVEGQYAIKNKKLVSLSEQELVDCDKRDDGCNGGLPENAYKTLLEIGGLESEADYGYDGEDEKCQFNRTKVVARVSGGLEISQNETQMAQWLFKNGPISVGLNANAMQFYMGGVSHPWKFLCNPDGIDHGVLIVGFGVHEYPLFHKTMPFWIIKNSWGPSWGEQGYYRLYRGDGTCGINMMTSSAVLADN